MEALASSRRPSRLRNADRSGRQWCNGRDGMRPAHKRPSLLADRAPGMFQRLWNITESGQGGRPLGRRDKFS